MLPYLSEFYGHPAGSHWFCRAAQEAMEDARSSVAALLDCHPAEVVFTAGGTESVNLGLLGAARAVARKSSTVLEPHFITTALEHACVLGCAKQLEAEGWEVTTLGCDANGRIEVEQFLEALRPETLLASIILASPVFGTLQPVAEIAEICEQKDILLHTDAAQAIGKVNCRIEHLGVDLLSLSGHKFYAPKGIGALFVRSAVPMDPLLYGDGCEAGIRPGTANVPFVVGLGQAAKLALAGLDSTVDQTIQMRDRFLDQLQSTLGTRLVVHGAAVDRLPNVLSIEFPGVEAETMQQRLPELCTGVSSAMGSGARSSHDALGLTEDQSKSTLRISLGWNTSEEELQQATQMLATAYEALKEEP